MQGINGCKVVNIYLYLWKNNKNYLDQELVTKWHWLVSFIKRTKVQILFLPLVVTIILKYKNSLGFSVNNGPWARQSRTLRETHPYVIRNEYILGIPNNFLMETFCLNDKVIGEKHALIRIYFLSLTYHQRVRPTNYERGVKYTQCRLYILLKFTHISGHVQLCKNTYLLSIYIDIIILNLIIY